ncbi:MAG: hypothetical protein ACKO3K_03715 [Cuspidothrix sp.]
MSSCQDYYSNSGGYIPILNVIDLGDKIGDIYMLNENDLTTAGLDFGHFQATGTYTMGFRFNKSLIPNGNYVANIFLDCGNDAVALKGKLQSVPEPNINIGLFFLGFIFTMNHIRKHHKITAKSQLFKSL